MEGKTTFIACNHAPGGGRPVAHAAHPPVDFAVQRAQAQAILGSTTLSVAEKRALFSAVLAGAVIDGLPGGRRAPGTAMPGIKIGPEAPKPEPRAHARQEPRIQPMPGIKIGSAVQPDVRAHARPATGVPRMPGIRIGAAS